MKMTVEMQIKVLEIRKANLSKANQVFMANATNDELDFLKGILKKAAKKTAKKDK